MKQSTILSMEAFVEPTSHLQSANRCPYACAPGSLDRCVCPDIDPATPLGELETLGVFQSMKKGEYTDDTCSIKSHWGLTQRV